MSTSRVIDRLTAPEVAARITRNSVLLFPIGSNEQHGPHLPLGTDTLIAEAYARRIIQRWGFAYDLWILPSLPFGVSPEHDWATGTISLRVASFCQVLMTVCAAIAQGLPARNLVIVNCHGGNRGVLDALVYDCRRQFGFNAVATHPSALAAKVHSVPVDIHAGIVETSLLLAIAHEAVRSTLIPPGTRETSRTNIAVLIQDRATGWPWTSNDPEISSAGVVGDATGASAELGERLLTSVTEEYGSILATLLRRGSVNEES